MGAVSIAVLLVVAAAIVFFRPARPVLQRASRSDVCTGVLAYVSTSLQNDAFHELTMNGCDAMQLTEQPDFSWTAAGGTSGTRYGLPVTVRWAARVASIGTPAALRICGFGLDATGNTYPPHLLRVGAC